MYPKWTATIELKRRTVTRLRTLQALPTTDKTPQNPLEMYQFQQTHAEKGQKIAALLDLLKILAAHLCPDLRREAVQNARRRHRQQDGIGRLKSRGWRPVRILLPDGSQPVIWTPYYRPDRTGRRGPRRQSGKRRKAGSGCYPLLEQLGIIARVTPLVRDRIARQVVLCSSYDEAQQQLARNGLKLPLSRIVPVAVQLGHTALKRRDEALQDALEDDLPHNAPLAGLRVQVSLDGGRTKTRKRKKYARIGSNGRRAFDSQWREPRVVTIGVLDEQGELDRSRLPVYEVSLWDADGVFDLLCGLLRRLGAYAAKEVIFVLDGAPWMWDRLDELVKVAEIRPERVTRILDFYHATEAISKALSFCKDLSEEERAVEFGRLRHRLRHEADGAEQVVAALQARARGRRAKTVGQKVEYLRGHLTHMRYARYAEAQQPLGSGLVESAVRRVINLRFKSASMAWLEEHLEPLLYLRALLKAGHWQRFITADLNEQHWMQTDIFEQPQERRKAA